jgi:hypothetical protein
MPLVLQVKKAAPGSTIGVHLPLHLPNEDHIQQQRIKMKSQGYTAGGG